MAWQQDAIDVAYEYDPETGLFRYGEADITVPRQSGKTTITLAKKVHRLTVLARLWGPQRSTYTAQTRLKARNKLERDFAELLRSSRSFREVANAKARPQKATEWRLSLNNGAEHIQFGRGNFLQIDAPSRTGGHGDTLDDATIDEAFTHEDDTVEAGMRPSMATRRNPQLWVISTAGDGRSKYLWRKVLAGRCRDMSRASTAGSATSSTRPRTTPTLATRRRGSAVCLRCTVLTARPPAATTRRRWRSSRASGTGRYARARRASTPSVAPT
jgi:phage terminase large subunit-like protein